MIDTREFNVVLMVLEEPSMDLESGLQKAYDMAAATWVLSRLKSRSAVTLTCTGALIGQDIAADGSAV